MRATHTIVMAALVAGFLLLPAPGRDAAYAQDGEPGTEGEDAKTQEAPKVPPLMEFNDRDRTILVKLPKAWRAEKGSPALPNLGSFEWPMEEGEGRRATLQILVQRDYAQAELARQRIQGSVGDIVEGSVLRGDGFSESCAISSRNPLSIFDRFVEKDGFVYHVRYVCHKGQREEQAPLARAILDSFEVLKPYSVPELGDGWQRSKEKPFIVWCDDDDKGAPDRVMEPVLNVRKVMEKALKGDPVDPTVPTVRVYRNAARYEDDCKAAVGEPRESSAYDANNRALMIELMKEGTTNFEWTVVQMAAQQYIHQYFGGNVPLWISRGMMIYGAVGARDSKGKPEKPPKDRTKKVKGVVISSSRRLDQYFDLKAQDIPNDQKSFDELWAWHWFFRHAKQGKKYRKTYQKCLETLRETGDLEAAHGVWEGTDFKKLQSDWRNWAKSLK